MENETPNVLQDFEQEIYLEKASTGTRFADYLIDYIAYYIVYRVAIGLYLLPNLTEMLRARRESYDGTSTAISALIVSYLAGMLLHLTYYTLFEGATNGKTLGKLITGTRAVKEDGSPIEWKDALLRSLCRIVPLEPFSALGGFPWHDRWTKTLVVKDNR